jgi:hypothetical protein
VHVSTWDEPRVRIEATKGAGTREALAAIEVVIESDGDGVRVRSKHPRGLFGQRNGQVEYEVHVPRGARLAIRNVNGGVEIRGSGGALQASTVNGSVEATGIAGEFAVSTVNGSVGVTAARVAPGSRNSVRTTNGAARVTLPRDTAADVEAHTVNGGVHCDFELGSGARISRRSLEGRIGDGGARVELRTVNGSAQIDRALSAAVPPTPEDRPAAEAPARPRAEAPALH